MKRPTQKERVLRTLRSAGARGITAVDFLAPTCDHGPSILRLPSRIDELKHDGHRIVPNGVRDACRIYVLAGDRRVPDGVESAPSVEKEQALIERQPANAVLGWDA